MKQKFELPLWVPADAWKGYEEARRRMGKPMTNYARKLAINKLAELQSQGYSATAVLEQSIFNSWQGLFPVHAQTVDVAKGPVGGKFKVKYLEKLGTDV